jgi:threonine/homoserine/homoserine lactone efflux protein
MFRTPKPLYAESLRRAIGGILFLVGVGSLFVSPLAPRLALIYAVIGAVCGALWISSDLILSYAGAAVLVFGVPYVAERAPGTVPWWQPSLIASSAVIFVYFLAPLFYRQIVRRRRHDAVRDIRDENPT